MGKSTCDILTYISRIERRMDPYGEFMGYPVIDFFEGEKMICNTNTVLFDQFLYSSTLVMTFALQLATILDLIWQSEFCI